MSSSKVRPLARDDDAADAAPHSFRNCVSEKPLTDTAHAPQNKICPQSFGGLTASKPR